jgi:hypothetical protein
MNTPAPLDRRSTFQVFPDMTVVNGSIQRTSQRQNFPERGRRGKPGADGVTTTAVYTYTATDPSAQSSSVESFDL